MPIPFVLVIPREGFRVRDPETMLLLPPEGITAPLGSHWVRQELDGAVDLEAIDPDPEPERPPKRAARNNPKTATPANADAEKG